MSLTRLYALKRFTNIFIVKINLGGFQMLKKRTLSICLVFVLLCSTLFTISVAAADFTNGVDVSGSTATIWFKSNVSTTWVDAHYNVNSGAQQNIRMTYNSSRARYEQNVTSVATGTVIKYSFTYNNGTPAYDSAQFTYTVGSSTPTTPAANGVTFYQDINYAGTAVTLGVGTYTLAQLNAAGIPDNWMTSLKVPSGYLVEVYQNDNFGGTKWTYTADNSWVGTAVNDQMSSVKVLAAVFYQDINYGGTAVALQPGNYTLSQMNAKGIPDNWMTSLKVPSGWTVEAYQNDNFTGTKWTYTASSGWVGTEVNDQMSSVKVYIGSPNNGNTSLIPVNSGMQMTLQFNNNTNGAWSNSQIYINIIGKNRDGRFCTIAPNGTMTPCVSGQNASPYFYPLSSMTGFQIPTYVSSGRLYISMGAPLNIPFNTAGDGTVGIAYPNIDNPSDASYKSYFDWAEFAVINGEIWINTTQVDMFGLPYTIELFTGSSTNYSSFAKAGITESRASIFSAFQAEVPAEFKSLATQQAPYRILAPIHGGFRTGQANGTYFNSYINSIWNQYTTSNFVLTVPQGTFTGRVSGTTMNFTRPGDATIYRVNKPTSEDVWGGAGALATGNEIEKVLQAQICAAFHRHVMENAANLNNPAAYYKAGPADYFSKFFHDHSLNAKAYGFCYDDVNDQSSTIHGVSPRGAIINIGW
jgi:hypothetical protein